MQFEAVCFIFDAAQLRSWLLRRERNQPSAWQACDDEKSVFVSERSGVLIENFCRFTLSVANSYLEI